MTTPTVSPSRRFHRIHHWWQRGPWHKAALLAALPMLAVCACCSGSFVFALTPYGQQLASQNEATETVQAEGQATANASATQYAVLHPATTVTPRPTTAPRPTSTPQSTPARKPTPRPTPTPNPVQAESGTYMSVLQNTNLMGKPTGVAVKPDGSLVVQDTFSDFGNPFMSTSGVLKLEMYDVMHALWTAHVPYHPGGIYVELVGPLTDQYGNVHPGGAAIATLSADTASLFNWDNLTPDEAWNDYDSAWMVPTS